MRKSIIFLFLLFFFVMELASAQKKKTAKPGALHTRVNEVNKLVQADSSNLVELFKDIHANPELGFMETRTAVIIAKELQATGYEVKTGIGIEYITQINKKWELNVALVNDLKIKAYNSFSFSLGVSRTW
ncbi:hypothetical protein [Flavihumibacter sp. UBA7668]|uniref:hypothetical protein n=1 Tax=Flavihumibacter sp. UBA7668 TaxID=1946542 RepID=UPI0025BF78B4|nr:hypothetical protein [Flavihumibacter sp. UBA7668]